MLCTVCTAVQRNQLGMSCESNQHLKVFDWEQSPFAAKLLRQVVEGLALELEPSQQLCALCLCGPAALCLNDMAHAATLQACAVRSLKQVWFRGSRVGHSLLSVFTPSRRAHGSQRAWSSDWLGVKRVSVSPLIAPSPDAAAGGFFLVFASSSSPDAARLPLPAWTLAQRFERCVAVACSTSNIVLVLNGSAEAAGCTRQQ